jgi:hypothetical protein
MTTLDLKLPRHLYRQTTNEDGEVTGITYLHDRLINWFDRGKGVQKLCETVYENELEKIADWEDNQLMLLEEEWLEVENGEDDDDNEAHYHLACDAVTREADEKRAVAKAHRAERQAAIEELVSQCAEHIEDCSPASMHTSHVAEYLIALVIMGALTYVLL